MRILTVTPSWPTPTAPEAGVFVVDQVEGLRRAGAYVKVLPFEGKKDIRNYARTRAALKKELRVGRYDIIHAQFGQAGLVVPRRRPPLVVTFHGSDLEGIYGRSGRYTVVGFLLSRLSRYVARRADHVITVSARLAHRLPRGTEHSVIPIGVNLEIFKPRSRADARRSLGLPLDARIILFGGNPARPVKRYSLAEAAVTRLEEARRAQLITVVGRKREHFATYMNAADVLLVTSQHEGGPLVVREALASDVPVVTVDVGDVRELLEGLSGCFVCGDDRPETIAQALEKALDHGPDFDGRWKVADLSIEKTIDCLMATFEQVTAKR